MLHLWNRKRELRLIHLDSCSLFHCLVIILAGLSALNACEAKKRQRPAANVIPSAKPPEGAPTDAGGGSQSPGGVNSAGAPADDYFVPFQRPEVFENRPTKDTDIFYSTVHYKSAGESWFKSCASIQVGKQVKGVGCSHPGQGEDSQPEFKKRQIWGFAPESANQSLELIFTTFRPKVVKCGTPEATSSNSTTDLCPGPMSSVSLPERRSTSHGGALKCLKNGRVHVIFYEDQSQGEVDPESKKPLYNNFERNIEARSRLKMQDGGAVPHFSDLRRIFEPSVLNAVYKDESGNSVTEKQLRGQFGIDYGDVIIQIDLGNAGHKLLGFEDCQ